MVTGTSLSDVFPLGSRVNELGRLEVGGCDTLELAREFGTPAYVVAEDDLRARARAFVAAGAAAGHSDFHVVFASKAFPCTAVLALFAQEGLWCDVASGGELHLALSAGFAPERTVLHGNAKSETELRMALERHGGELEVRLVLPDLVPLPLRLRKAVLTPLTYSYLHKELRLVRDFDVRMARESRRKLEEIPGWWEDERIIGTP